jgi:hypothetical protein
MGIGAGAGKKAGNLIRLPFKPSNSARNLQISPGSRELAGNLWKSR